MGRPLYPYPVSLATASEGNDVRRAASSPSTGQEGVLGTENQNEVRKLTENQNFDKTPVTLDTRGRVTV